MKMKKGQLYLDKYLPEQILLSDLKTDLGGGEGRVYVYRKGGGGGGGVKHSTISLFHESLHAGTLKGPSIIYYICCIVIFVLKFNRRGGTLLSSSSTCG